MNLDAAPPRPGFGQRLRELRWLRPLNDPEALDGLLGWLNPLWSLTRLRARLLAVRAETADTRTYTFRANRHWRGARAGQHLLLAVEIDGVRLQRCFSISSAEAARDQQFDITVRRHPGSRVATWLERHASPGLVLEFGAPSGRFVLPEVLPPALLMLSAGSGITPLMSMLRTLQQRGWSGDLVFVHACRTPAELIFGRELQQLARTWPSLRLLLHYSASQGRLEPDELVRLVPDFAGHTAFLCGPAGFMQSIQALYREAGAADRLHHEDFQARPAPAPRPGMALQVQCRDSRRSFASDGSSSLLASAEAAGLQPAHGCRIGICMSCQCRKRSGTVENLRTGVVSAAPDQWIQLCVSVPRSDLELDL